MTAGQTTNTVTTVSASSTSNASLCGGQRSRNTAALNVSMTWALLMEGVTRIELARPGIDTPMRVRRHRSQSIYTAEKRGQFAVALVSGTIMSETRRQAVEMLSRT